MARQDEFRVVVLREPKTLYRGAFGRDQATLIHALASNYEAGRSPHPADLRATVLHMAISGFEHPDVLLRLARKRPDRVGTHIVTLELQSDHGICVADTGSPGHWSIWGTPAQLLDLVADVHEV